MMEYPDWLHVHRGDAPLIVSISHAGTQLPACYRSSFVSQWLARKDVDWWLEKLYDFVHQELGATVVRTEICRSIIDVNRDPSGASLYPGQATTELCPSTTFDGEALYLVGEEPTPDKITQRTKEYFEPYHRTLRMEIDRLQAQHANVVLYDAHSIRSRIPRLFSGELPHLNLGTNDGQTCDAGLQQRLTQTAANSGFSHVENGRFKGGWITRHYGSPSDGVHAVQMEIACRSYMRDPDVIREDEWPTPYLPASAQRLREILRVLLSDCLQFAELSNQKPAARDHHATH
ncbi:N-formylglutamate deformylase [Silvibacterium dinghuense]|uniref:N-formylglutamate deformylase n=1 Tax=Silvibacterium dinghuense TaxID=1560006 RepID=A0A4Q1SF26_9BACT|nr:N-formylglutamate deformylase [Silvibacterium dinghuense]